MAAVLATVLVACSPNDAAPHVATPTTSSDTQRAHTERPKTAPAITRELDLSKYRDKPCELLSSAQVGALGFSGKAERFGSEICRWHAANADFSYIVYLDRNELQIAYDTLQGVTYDVFQPQVISGQPAVAYASYAGAPACSLGLGIAHDQGVFLIISGRDHEDWCAQLVTAATDIVHNLGG